MDVYTVNFTQVELELLAYMSLHTGEKLSQREIAKSLKVSPTAVANAVKTLTAQNLLTREPTKTINFISYNRSNPKAIMLKKIENQKQLIVSGLAEYLEEQLAGATAILFGSYAKGEDTTASDIDIAIIGRKTKALQLQSFEKMLCRTININYYPSWKVIHRQLRNNILNGSVLFGGVDL